MKLIFPNGEHEPVMLKDGITRIGSGADCQIVLAAPGIALHHCEIELRAGQGTVRPLDAGAVTVLNGRQIAQPGPLKIGDLLLFARVGCRVATVDRAPAPAAAAPAPRKDDEESRTRIRQALPKFMLRGVSGATFGKTFALVGTMTVGRASDCDISIPADEISRHHARLQAVPEGVMVEDLGSANGTWINDKRVHNGMLRAGEELRLDTIRFLLLSPSADMHAQAAKAEAAATASAAQASADGKSHAIVWVVVGLVVLAVAAFAVLRYLGKV